ncbi:secondary thiamine-phosphate synthase enzyme YjbQ [Caldivirga sp. UBA161]|uniref:secondary thiamine-phosphate synthase enzyme YjbQ n=1 Tax=Caldivirga sp. UBA161 TaxID=1915569 RepID=UPI0025B8402F|nr:secondary thiamine-phosphate synthase enzyme YjbQ [Caldivirga sp. UBA161]
MKVFVKELKYASRRQVEVIDITSDVEEVVNESGIRNGFIIVFAPHATAAVILNENESGLLKDIEDKILELFPRSGNYRHNLIDDNANSHLASAFLGQGKVIPLINGSLVRGTWQNILLVELDGPRAIRRVIVEVIGE